MKVNELFEGITSRPPSDIDKYLDRIEEEQEDINSISIAIGNKPSQDEKDEEHLKQLEHDSRALEVIKMVLQDNKKAIAGHVKDRFYLYDMDGDEIVAAVEVKLKGDLAQVKWIGSVRKGHGRPLLQQALRQAKTHGASRVQLTSKWESEGFYHKMGFKKTGDFGTFIGPMSDFSGSLGEAEGNQTELYHVTLTKNINNITKKGLIPFRPTNWVKAGNLERYGDGSLFAFEHLKDAIRWACRWDWDLNKNLGTGKISILVFNTDMSKWQIDDADPLGQAGASGKWLKSMSPVPAKDIQKVIPLTPNLVRQATLK